MPLRSVRLTLPWPPTVNDAFTRDRNGRQRHTKAYRDYRDFAGYHVEQCLPACCPFTVPVAVEINAYPPDRYKRDLDNVLKVLLDAMESMGVYADDYLIADLRIVRKEVVKDGKVEVCVEPV